MVEAVSSDKGILVRCEEAGISDFTERIFRYRITGAEATCFINVFSLAYRFTMDLGMDTRVRLVVAKHEDYMPEGDDLDYDTMLLEVEFRESGNLDNVPLLIVDPLLPKKIAAMSDSEREVFLPSFEQIAKRGPAVNVYLMMGVEFFDPAAGAEQFKALPASVRQSLLRYNLTSHEDEFRILDGMLKMTGLDAPAAPSAISRAMNEGCSRCGYKDITWHSVEQMRQMLEDAPEGERAQFEKSVAECASDTTPSEVWRCPSCTEWTVVRPFIQEV